MIDTEKRAKRVTFQLPANPRRNTFSAASLGDNYVLTEEELKANAAIDNTEEKFYIKSITGVDEVETKKQKLVGTDEDEVESDVIVFGVSSIDNFGFTQKYERDSDVVRAIPKIFRRLFCVLGIVVDINEPDMFSVEMIRQSDVYMRVQKNLNDGYTGVDIIIIDKEEQTAPNHTKMQHAEVQFLLNYQYLIESKGEGDSELLQMMGSMSWLNTLA